MKLLIVLCCIFGALAEEVGTGVDDRIINGQPARRGEFPWQAGIFHTINNVRLFCSGALISNEWILTAAHCVYNAYDFEIILGATLSFEDQEGKVTLVPEKCIYHPDYFDPLIHNDVAVIKIPRVEYTEFIQPVNLPPVGSYLSPNSSAVISGWGYISNENLGTVNALRYAYQTTMSNEECKEHFFVGLILDNVVCCEGTVSAACQGDSGGPLVQLIDGKWTSVGIVSFNNGAGCGAGPSAYARTASFLDFIYAETGLQPR